MEIILYEIGSSAENARFKKAVPNPVGVISCRVRLRFVFELDSGEFADAVCNCWLDGKSLH